jgi:hypothetical protein
MFSHIKLKFENTRLSGSRIGQNIENAQDLKVYCCGIYFCFECGTDFVLYDVETQTLQTVDRESVFGEGMRLVPPERLVLLKTEMTGFTVFL